MRKTVRRLAKIIVLTASIPLCLAALAYCGLCAYVVHYNDKVLPNISVAGVDLSRLTYEQALRAVDVREYGARGIGAEVKIAFPNGSELNITGEEARLCDDSLVMVDEAFSRGRGNGYIDDSLEFLGHLDITQRLDSLLPIKAVTESFEINYELDAESLRERVSAFTDSYNDELEGCGPQIVDDTIIFTKGAGHVCVSEADVYDLAYNGLFLSLAEGRPVEIAYALPESQADAQDLLAIRQRILTDPLSAEYDVETNTISESVVGVDIDIAGAITLLAEAESGTTVLINVEYTEPEVTQEFLESLLFRDLIGECVTQIPGTENRLNNIILATEAVDGYVLEPGEEFSFNRIVGRRTYERGYRLAPAFASGQTVQAIGGGICQVSSTIYSAIKDTDIRVTERYAHGLPVAYIPRGRDATVSWGSLDFRFINNTEYPIRIDASVTGRTLTVELYGTLHGPATESGLDPGPTPMVLGA